MLYITIRTDRSATKLPAIPPEVLERATAADLRFLIRLCATKKLPAAENMNDLCAALLPSGGSSFEIAASIAFWRGAGVLDLTEAPNDVATTLSEQPVESASSPAPDLPVSTPTPQSVDKPVSPDPAVMIRRADRLPHYSSADISAILESQADARANLDECARIWGKMLSFPETSELLVMSEYLKLDWDYIISLLARCVEDAAKRGVRPSMRTVERRALEYYDADIRTLDTLQEKFRALDRLAGMEHKLRDLFGMGERKLTPNETRYFSTWLYDFNYDIEIIQMAYNVTVDTKGTPKMSYINSILSNWNSKNLRTPAEIDADQATFRAERERTRGKHGTGATPSGGSFDTDDFFAAAVKRSLGEDI